jgi:hypothetical protein
MPFKIPFLKKPMEGTTDIKKSLPSVGARKDQPVTTFFVERLAFGLGASSTGVSIGSIQSPHQTGASNSSPG